MNQVKDFQNGSEEFWLEISVSQQPYQVIHIQMLEKKGKLFQ